MLRDVLLRLARGGIDTLDRLASELGTSPRELDEMLSKLRELGYIEDAASGMEAACRDGQKSCAGCSGCSGGCGKVFPGSGKAGKVWRLTAKGIEAAGK